MEVALLLDSGVVLIMLLLMAMEEFPEIKERIGKLSEVDLAITNSIANSRRLTYTGRR